MEHTADPPEGASPGRRRLLRRPIRIPEGQEPSELVNLLLDYAQALDRRLDSGLRELHKSAALLMRQLAAEVWRAGGPEAGKNLRESVVGALARDDAVRGLLAHTEERFQRLAGRLDHMEGGMRRLAEAARDVVRHVNERASDLERMTQTVSQGPEALTRLERALEPLAARLDATTTGVRASQERQREDLARFGERTSRGLAQAREQIEEGVRGELQRLEAAIQSEAAFAREAATDLRQQVESLAERTGVVLDGIRAEVRSLIEDDRERVQRLHAGERAVLKALDSRTQEGLASISQRLEEGFRSSLERAREAGEETLQRIGGLQEAQDRQGERLGSFIDHTRLILQEVVRRTQEGLALAVDQAAAASRESVAELERSIKADLAELARRSEDIAGRTGAVLEGMQGDLAHRLEQATGKTRDEAIRLVTELITRQAGQQAQSLRAITDSLQEILGSVRDAGERQSASIQGVLRAAAERQAALVEETLAGLRASVGELASVHERSSEGETAAFSRRLRSVEQRMARLSRELSKDLGPEDLGPEELGPTP